MKKAFTLIELLAVIVILAIIASIITPRVLSSINNSNIKIKENNIELFKQAAYKYTIIHEEDFIEKTNAQISIQTLINEGLIDNKEYTDPTTKNKMNGCIKLTYNVNKYNFEYIDICE